MYRRKLCRTTQSENAHRTESVSVMDHERTMGVSSTVLDRKQQNIFDHISLFWSVELQGHLVNVHNVFSCGAQCRSSVNNLRGSSAADATAAGSTALGLCLTA